MKTRRAYSPETRAAAVADYTAGLTAEQVRERHGVNESTLYKWAKAEGANKNGSPDIYEGGWVVIGGIQRPAVAFRTSRSEGISCRSIGTESRRMETVRNGPGNAVVAHRPGPHPTLVRSAEL